ncbi:MAG: sulfurtransferase TusA family protein [Dechloromonas sp.]|jgi:tRNA 2-thiouridine synthesizing protein A|nr:sulfurtransferase TusA family protein [Dechloromonas sp.]
MSHPKAPHVVDARYMEPPEPFVQTMEMLDRLKPGEKMLLLLFREPHPLYKVLRQNGHAYETELLADGTFEILIRR